ncbi:uncharacterized protein LOC124172737 [Ischnura elegans]|uniref:uncharacterized protein LOC124172737 n=1 Tax=Ischnura elegans TaxID=197161 RepID=UPI001ED8AF3C|nr:uncharacterized protein LOC124172737 [Ischnura elegans]
MAYECLFTSPRCVFFTFTLLNQLLPSILGATYHSHDVTSDTVCNRYHKRELQVYMSDPVILETRPESAHMLTLGLSLSCTFEMEAKGFYTTGVVSVVQSMNFRSHGDNCLDYMQTIYEDEDNDMKLKRKKSKKKKILKKVVKAAVLSRRRRDTDDEDGRGPRICGRVLFGLQVDENETLPPPFADPLPPTKPDQGVLSSLFWDAPNPYQSLVSDAAEVDHKGEIKTRLHISNRMLRQNEDVNLKVVYTAYQECDGRRVPESLFHCGYGLCISRSLVNDGLVNCPFGDCADEVDCASAKEANIIAKVLHYERTDETSVWWIILWVLVGLVLMFLACCGGIFLFMRRRKH